MNLQSYIHKASVFRWPVFIGICLVPLLGGCSGAQLNLGGVLEQLFIGLILGSVYALIALGYTLVYGVIKLINFAHGDIYMLGAFLGYYLLRFTIRWLHFNNGVSLIWCFVISTVVSAIVCAALAIIMERFAYRPLRGSSRIAALITAVGVSFLLENAGIIVFGPNPRGYQPNTLEVYQLEVAADAAFHNARPAEIIDATQQEFPAERFTATSYARVRIVTKAGSSPWSPVLEIEPKRTGGYVEEETVDGGDTPQRLNSLGYTRRQEDGKSLLTISWAGGQPEDIRLPPVFSDSQGKTLAFELPIATGSGANLRVPVFNIVIVVVALLLLWGLNILINKSMFGISMRALSFDSDAAKLMGVNTDLVIAQTFAVGGACAAIAGNMVGIYNQTIEPLMGILPGIKAFVAAVVGGIGSIPGAAAGGMIMGLSEALVKGYINPRWSMLADALAFAILIAVLLFKPTGIFGTAVKEKV